MKRTTLILSLCLLGAGLLPAQTVVPRIFLLNEAEQAYEKLSTEYSQTLLEANGHQIEKALDSWVKMMQAIDAYAEQQNFDIKGVKLWMHVFWNPNGGIDHIGFMLRPESRYVNPTELKALLGSFARTYTLPVRGERRFSHYTGSTFPTLSERAAN